MAAGEAIDALFPLPADLSDDAAQKRAVGVMLVALAVRSLIRGSG